MPLHSCTLKCLESTPCFNSCSISWVLYVILNEFLLQIYICHSIKGICDLKLSSGKRALNHRWHPCGQHFFPISIYIKYNSQIKLWYYITIIHNSTPFHTENNESHLRQAWGQIFKVAGSLKARSGGTLQPPISAAVKFWIMYLPRSKPTCLPLLESCRSSHAKVLLLWYSK